MDTSKKHQCECCGDSFSCRSNLNKHKQRFGHHTIPIQKEGKLQCGLCKIQLQSQSGLCAHVTQIHNIPAEIKEAVFTSIHDFKQWKSELEERNKFTFTKHKENLATDGIMKTRYLYCHRSGSYNSQCLPGRLKKQNFTKMGSQCTCFAIVKTDQSTELVTVTFCDTHYGHDNRLAYIRISDDIRQEIIGHILDGFTTDQIVEKMRRK